jgi:hypothetical protein
LPIIEKSAQRAVENRPPTLTRDAETLPRRIGYRILSRFSSKFRKKRPNFSPPPIDESRQTEIMKKIRGVSAPIRSARRPRSADASPQRTPPII